MGLSLLHCLYPTSTHSNDKPVLARAPSSLTKSKVEALLDAPATTNVAELLAFLGFVQYYGRFYRNVSTINLPMNALLRKNVVWKWTNE